MLAGQRENVVCPYSSFGPAHIEEGEGFTRVIAFRNATLYTCAVIKSFRHKGLQAFFETGVKAGIQPHHAARLKRQLTRLDLAAGPEAMNLPGWKLHPLTNGHWSVWVNGNWRLTFTFEGTDAVLVDYHDYH